MLAFHRGGRLLIHYLLEGPAEAPVVAFGTSIGSDLTIWDAQVAALRDRYRCLRFDWRGHGKSTLVEGPTRIADLAEDLAGLLDSLGIAHAHIVGLSLGGMAALTLAAERPEKVASLTVMASAAYLPPAETWHERAALVRSQGMAALVDSVMARWFTPKADPDKVRRVRDSFLSQDPRGYAACCEAIADYDMRPGLSRIRARTLLIAGAQDAGTPPTKLEEIQAGIAGTELVVLSDAAHQLAVEQPDKTNELLARFLT